MDPAITIDARGRAGFIGFDEWVDHPWDVRAGGAGVKSRRLTVVGRVGSPLRVEGSLGAGAGRWLRA